MSITRRAKSREPPKQKQTPANAGEAIGTGQFDPVVSHIAEVYDDGEAGFRGEFEVCEEKAELSIPRGAVAVEIKPRFANRNYPFVRNDAAYLVHVAGTGTRGLVWMDSGGGIYDLMALRERDGGARRGGVDSPVEHETHTRMPPPPDHIVTVGVKIIQIEMRVGIGKHVSSPWSPAIPRQSA